MSRKLTLIGLIVALLMLVLFALDLAIKQPFGRASVLMDSGMIFASLIVLVMGVSTLLEQR